MKVMFYVKDKLLKAKDGYEVAAILKEKIGNEEGFFEFRMLKVEPYSKYSNVRSPDDDDDDYYDYYDYDYFLLLLLLLLLLLTLLSSLL